MPASSTTKWGLLVLAFLILLSSFSTVVVVGQQQQQQQQMQYTEAQLRAMTEQQLEEICIQRGFELLKDEVDPATGEVYQLSHDDYVEAAMRCLAIEQEMNELLEQYPELAEELEEEIKRMELENASKQAELDSIQQNIGSDGTQGLNEGGSGSVQEGGTAFVPRGGDQGAAEQAAQTSLGDAEVGGEHLTLSEGHDVMDETADTEAHGEPLADSETTEESNDTKSKEMEGTSRNSTSSKEDFELSHLAIESLRAFVLHAKDDVKRILDLVVPVMQPLLTAGDAAWRQIKALFVKARDAYCEVSQSCESSKEQSSDEAEPAEDCEESVIA